jgi:transcriptional regulator with XRE-family HTH domain
MARSTHHTDYAIFLACLRTARKGAGLTQGEVADRLGQTQSFVSKCELGERRIDIVELRSFCQATGVSLADFVHDFEFALTRAASPLP